MLTPRCIRPGPQLRLTKELPALSNPSAAKHNLPSPTSALQRHTADKTNRRLPSHADPENHTRVPPLFQPVLCLALSGRPPKCQAGMCALPSTDVMLTPNSRLSSDSWVCSQSRPSEFTHTSFASHRHHCWHRNRRLAPTKYRGCCATLGPSHTQSLGSSVCSSVCVVARSSASRISMCQCARQPPLLDFPHMHPYTGPCPQNVALLAEVCPGLYPLSMVLAPWSTNRITFSICFTWLESARRVTLAIDPVSNCAAEEAPSPLRSARGPPPRLCRYPSPEDTPHPPRCPPGPFQQHPSVAALLMPSVKSVAIQVAAQLSSVLTAAVTQCLEALPA